ncbi:MAG: GNAT family N-acetyltransferase [Polyangiales bacterium]
MADSARPIVIRPATHADLRAVSVLAGELVRLHHAFDAKRFLLIEGVEAGYERFFATQLDRAVILVAVQGAMVVGYAYAASEPRDWNLLLDAHGTIHDVYVAPLLRRQGLAKRLVVASIEALKAIGVRKVILHSAFANVEAHRLFESVGFRKTMVEMMWQEGE